MKKSKIIVPALGLLLLSTAASISGTVAWFTAQTTYDLNASNFQVTKLDGDLECDLADGVGTTTSANTVTIDKTQVEMADASFDHTSGMLYTDTLVSDTYQELANVSAVSKASPGAWRVGSTTKYYAVSWTMTFKFKFVAETTDMNLYLNVDSTNGSALTGKKISDDSAASATDATWKGLRIAFVGQTATYTNKKVWAGGEAKASCSYVSSTSAVTSLSSSNDLIATDTTGTLLTSATTGADTVPNCLGKFAQSQKVASGNDKDKAVISFTCVAWFEGTDPNIVNDKEMDYVVASLKFFVRPQSA